MAELLVSAPAKINLHLEVLGLRPDGFHELAMVMQTLDLEDQLSFRPTADGAITIAVGNDSLFARLTRAGFLAALTRWRAWQVGLVAAVVVGLPRVKRVAESRFH